MSELTNSNYKTHTHTHTQAATESLSNPLGFGNIKAYGQHLILDNSFVPCGFHIRS